MNTHNGHRLRTGRASLTGQIYLVTTVTRNRHPYFASLAAARAVVGALRSAETHGHAQTLCFVVMPDHLHWLMALGDGQDLGTVVRGIKGMTSRRLGIEGIWQRGFHDRALRREEDVVTVGRYVVANPLRAGLVRSVREYSHWDAIWL